MNDEENFLLIYSYDPMVIVDSLFKQEEIFFFCLSPVASETIYLVKEKEGKNDRTSQTCLCACSRERDRKKKKKTDESTLFFLVFISYNN